MNEQSLERQEGFLYKLQSLLNDYDVEMTVIDRYEGASIELSFLPEKDPVTYDMTREFFTYNMGAFVWPQIRSRVIAESNGLDQRAGAPPAPMNPVVGQVLSEDKE